MPRAPKPTSVQQHRSTPYPVTASTTLAPSAMASHHTSPHTSSTSDRHVAQSWTPENDELLMRARQQGLNWQPIASKYFPDKTSNACRKRHERLMEKRNNADNWDGVKMDKLSKAYLDLREQMWKILADRVGEKWQSVEAKCMEKGLKTLQTAGRSASRREANHSRDLEPDDICSRSHQDEEDGFNDSAIGPDDHSFGNGNAMGSRGDDQQQAPYSAGGISNHSTSYSSAPSFSSPPSSLAGYTPTATAAPQPFPISQQPQTLPSFSDAFGMPSISAVLHHSPHHSPAVTTH